MRKTLYTAQALSGKHGWGQWLEKRKKERAELTALRGNPLQKIRDIPRQSSARRSFPDAAVVLTDAD